MALYTVKTVDQLAAAAANSGTDKAVIGQSNELVRNAFSSLNLSTTLATATAGATETFAVWMAKFAGTTTDEVIARYDSTTGKLQNSGITLSDANNLIGVNNAFGVSFQATSFLLSPTIFGTGATAGSILVWPKSSRTSYAQVQTGLNTAGDAVGSTEQNQLLLNMTTHVDVATKYFNSDMRGSAYNPSASPTSKAVYSLGIEGLYLDNATFSQARVYLWDYLESDTIWMHQRTEPTNFYFGTTTNEINVILQQGFLRATNYLHAMSGTAIPAGGTAGAGLRVSSTANFGVFFGSGAPTLSAAKGSLYLRSDGSGVGDRAYINTNGTTTWTALTTAA